MDRKMGKQEPIFSETDEMYALTDLINEFEFIDSRNLDHYIGGESEVDLENEVDNYLTDLNDEMMQLVNFINENFKNIKVALPALSTIKHWIKHYKKQKKIHEDKLSEYTTQYWIGYQTGQIHMFTSIINTLEYIKERIES